MEIRYIYYINQMRRTHRAISVHEIDFPEEIKIYRI